MPQILITSRDANFLKAASCCTTPWSGEWAEGSGRWEGWWGGIEMDGQRPGRLIDASNCFTWTRRLISRWSQHVYQIKPSPLLHPNGCFLWCFKRGCELNQGLQKQTTVIFFLKWQRQKITPNIPTPKTVEFTATSSGLASLTLPSPLQTLSLLSCIHSWHINLSKFALPPVLPLHFSHFVQALSAPLGGATAVVFHLGRSLFPNLKRETGWKTASWTRGFLALKSSSQSRKSKWMKKKKHFLNLLLIDIFES